MEPVVNKGVGRSAAALSDGVLGASVELGDGGAVGASGDVLDDASGAFGDVAFVGEVVDHGEHAVLHGRSNDECVRPGFRAGEVVDPVECGLVGADGAGLEVAAECVAFDDLAEAAALGRVAGDDCFVEVAGELVPGAAFGLLLVGELLEQADGDELGGVFIAVDRHVDECGEDRV